MYWKRLENCASLRSDDDTETIASIIRERENQWKLEVHPNIISGIWWFYAKNIDQVIRWSTDVIGATCREKINYLREINDNLFNVDNVNND